MTYAETQEYLFALRALGSKFGLERMHALYNAAGRPGCGLPIVHVAGTNGKGSVCAMVEAIARANGYKTGLFTSPHLLRLGERIQVDREILSEEQIVDYVAQLRPLCEQLSANDPHNHPTFFELMTVIALRHFEREGCEIIVLETGLGGRLDSTNVVQPAVTVITSIGLDHQEILGNTLEEIAAEKAGIIKHGVPLVLGRLPSVAEQVILERASALGVEVLRADALFASGTQVNAAPAVDTASGLAAAHDATVGGAMISGLRPYPHTSLVGEYQRRNAAVALLTYEQLCRTDVGKRDATAPQLANDPQASLAALRSVQWAGRWQTLTLENGCELILDSSHNEEGARALEENLSRFVAERGLYPGVITGALGEARADSLLQVIARYTDTILLVEVSQPRACSLAQMRAAVPASFSGKVRTATVGQLFASGQCAGELLGSYLEGEPLRPVLVTGSIYLIGEILSRLQGIGSAEAVHLQDKISG